MGKLVTIFLLISALLGALANGLVVAMPDASSTTSQMPQHLHPSPEIQNPNAERNTSAMFLTVGFFVHQVGDGPNKTVWNVAYSENTLTSPSSFGLIQMVDNIMTVGPLLDSLTLGRIQGTITYADLHETALSVNLNIIFTENTAHRGSSVNVQGRLPASESPYGAEMSIVGGTGSFWAAKGIASIHLLSFNPSTHDSLSACLLYITTPDMIISE